jgi:hypothetical protein
MKTAGTASTGIDVDRIPTSGAENATIVTDALMGYIAGYHEEDMKMAAPVELWPRMQQREIYLSALRDFDNGEDYYAHQTAKNFCRF